jgi:hypothetical protein
MDWGNHTESMKAAIALLSDFPIQNIARKMTYAIHQRAPIQFFGSLLPAHVSLKQPFSFESIDALETWFDSFSHQILFHYPVETIEPGSFICYKVLPLTANMK